MEHLWVCKPDCDQNAKPAVSASLSTLLHLIYGVRTPTCDPWNCGDDAKGQSDNNSNMTSTPTTPRNLTPIDHLLSRLDTVLKSALGPHGAGRAYPAENITDTVTDPATRRQIAGLMRVNHAGEICAQ